MTKFPQPIISVLDLGADVVLHLSEAGYNVSGGTFGSQYQVSDPWDFHKLPEDYQFPRQLGESEIVIVNLNTPILDTLPKAKATIVKDGIPVWAKPNFGIIDTRPLRMRQVHQTFDRIYAHGGLFVIFAEPKETITMRFPPRAAYTSPEELEFSNWGFLSILDSYRFEAKADKGNQINIVAETKLWETSLKRFLSGATFLTTLDYTGPKHRFIPLAKNRYDGIVAAALVPESDDGGTVLLFPTVTDHAGFLLDLLQNVLPENFPHLFPSIEKVQWDKQDVYQPSRVIEIQDQIWRVQKAAELEIVELRNEMEEERAKYSYLMDLITETDQKLVHAVKSSFNTLGFADVVNFDDELLQRGASHMREDLHIRDRSPLVLVEVKGIRGTSTEADALQVTKYLVPRMRELKRTDLHALAVFNHERNLAPLDRRPVPFTDDVIANAQHPRSGFSLLTTWNLYKLVRNFIKHNWTHSQVADLFYQHGFIEPVPLHYSYIGTAERFIEDIGVVGVKIEQGSLKLGDRIAFELDVEFEEQEIQSMQFENKQIETAEVGQLVGITTHLTKEQLRKNPRVFRVDPTYKANPEGT